MSDEPRQGFVQAALPALARKDLCSQPRSEGVNVATFEERLRWELVQADQRRRKRAGQLETPPASVVQAAKQAFGGSLSQARRRVTRS